MQMIKYTNWTKMLVLAGLLLSSFGLQASHIVGGDISYTCLGNNQYEIELSVFRDCFYGNPDAFFDDPASVGVFNQYGVLVTEVKMFFMEDDTLDNVLNDPCLFVPGDVCVHTTTYRKTVTLPYIEGGYQLVYQRCCRNQTINNITLPDETGATYFIWLTEEALTECNSSPKFGGIAPIFICVNKQIDYDHSAIDVDGDSLVYKMCTPYAGASLDDPKPVPPNSPPYEQLEWLPPYSEADMLGNPNAPLSINSETGELMGFPTIIGQFVVGVCVEEYRDGVLLSRVRRDFQYNVGVCGEIVSAFFAPEAQCDDLEVSFDNQSLLSNDFQWYFDSEGDLSLETTEESPIYTFPDTGTYNVMLIAEPGSTCVDTFTQEIFLQYNSLFADYEVEVFDCSDSSVITVTDLSYDTITSPVEWDWTLIYGTDTLTSAVQNPQFYIPSGETATLELIVRSETGCERSLSTVIETGLDNPGQYLEDQFDICFGDSIELNPNFAQIGNHPYTWGPPDLFDNPSSPTQMVSPETTTVYNVSIEAPGGFCAYEQDITVDVTPLPELDFDYSVNCDGYTVEFNNGSNNSPGYAWDFGDPNTSGDTSTDPSPTYTYPDYGQYNVSLATPPGALCRDTITELIDVPERILEAGFAFELISCETDEQVIQFNDQSINNLTTTVDWDWDFGSLGTATGPNPTITVTSDQTVTVTLTITTNEGCTDTYEEIFDVELINEDLITPKLICRGGSVELNPTGNPNYEYLWTPSTGLDDPTSPNPVASPDQTTVYTVNITQVTFDTCTIVRNVIVVVPPDIQLSTTGDIETCDPEATIFATTVEPADLQWYDANDDVVGTDDELTVEVSGVNVYEVIATDNYGCTESETVTISGGPVSIEASPDQIVCSDEPIDVSVVNLDPNDILTYNWTPGSGIISGANTANPTISNEAGETTFYVDVENQFGCTESDTVFVAVVDSEIDLDFDAIVQCDGGTVEFVNQSTNAYNYVWNFGDPNTTLDTSTLENPTYQYPEMGTYYVQLTILYNDLDCVDDAVVPVEIEEPILFADFDFAYEACSEDSIEISFTDLSYNFLDDTNEWIWTFSNGEVLSEQNPTITIYYPETPLSANLTINTEIGCTASTTELLEIEFIENNLADTIIMCYGDTTQLNPDGNFTYEYEWFPATGLDDPNSPNPNASPTETTTYTTNITLFGPDTCSIARTVTVFVPTPIVVDATEDSVTCWEPVDLNVVGNVNPLDYTWYANGEVIGTGPDINVAPDTTTTYYVFGQDEYSCFNSDSLVITVPEVIELVTTPDSITCGDPIFISVEGNVDPLDFVWTDEDGNVIGMNPTIEVDPAVSGVYYVDVFDQYECTVGDSVMVTNGEVDLQTDGNLIICPVDSTQISATNLDPTDMLDYEWSTGVGGTILSGANTNTPWVSTEPGINIYYVDVENQFGCTYLDSVTVIMSDFNPTELDTVRICPGVPTAINPNGNPNYEYEWFPATGLSDDSVFNPDATLFEDMVYTVTITDLNGVDTCDATLQVYVQVNPDMELSTFGDTILCDYGDVDISANSIYADGYTWFDDPDLNNPIGTGDEIIVSPEGTSNYWVVAEDDLGCLDTGMVVINAYPLDFSLQGEYLLCINEELELEVINNASDQTLEYLWGPTGDIIMGGTDSVAIVSPQDTSTFYVTVTNQYGCEGMDSTQVNVIDMGIGLFAMADPDTIILNAGDSAYLWTVDNPDYLYTWDPGETLDNPFVFNPVAFPTETTTYTVFVEGDNGCISSREVEVVVIDPSCTEPFVFVPSGFTPNGDGNNDGFYVRGNNIDEVYIAVYNRWGQKLFETNDKDIGWDGTFKGRELPPDTYGYYLEAKCYNGDTYFKKGNITLIR
ncbi:MAG: T9SS type B sorting domain-containing protein [Bacteroidetes bacterium]|nr:T9SS type B sorting domain-containing protein [Bacteroidota bacterium]